MSTAEVQVATHTPGPWLVGEQVDSERRLVYIPIVAGKTNISATGVYGRRADGSAAGDEYKDRYGTIRSKPSIPEDECRANARLIAAAPDLLAACETALACLVDGDEDDGEAGAELRAAIAMAKGGES